MRLAHPVGPSGKLPIIRLCRHLSDQPVRRQPAEMTGLGSMSALACSHSLMPSFRFDRDLGANWEQAPSIVRKDDNGRVDPLRVADPRRNRAAILLVARPSRSRPTIDGAMNSRGTPSATVF
jgi:hypothetical protein